MCVVWWYTVLQPGLYPSPYPPSLLVIVEISSKVLLLNYSWLFFLTAAMIHFCRRLAPLEQDHTKMMSVFATHHKMCCIVVVTVISSFTYISMHT